jgi:hypothetical protein
MAGTTTALAVGNQGSCDVMDDNRDEVGNAGFLLSTGVSSTIIATGAE